MITINNSRIWQMGIKMNNRNIKNKILQAKQYYQYQKNYLEIKKEKL